jgi:hypothetical protein
LSRSPWPNTEVLVELDAPLSIEVDVEQLAVPQRLADAVHEVEAGHLLVAHLGVEPDHLVVLQRRDEGERVPDRRQQDVAARLVRLGLQREPQSEVVVDDVLRERVHALAVAVEGGPHVLGAVVLRALAAAPHDVGLAPSSAARSMLRITLRSA